MLVLMIIDEDSKLIERTYLEMNAELRRVAYSILHSHYDAEAAVQEAFANIMASIESFREVPDDKKQRYCYVVVKNVSLNILSKNKQNSLTVTMLDDTLPEPADTSAYVEIIAEEKEDMAALRRKLYEVDEAYRRPLILRFVHGFRYKQIADFLGISEALARKRVERAIKKLTDGARGESAVHV
jgi:RNA polymerase sigma-70 factor (ECF subfamily)